MADIPAGEPQLEAIMADENLYQQPAQPAPTPGFWQSNVLGPLGLKQPTQQDWIRGVSETLGGPVDGPAYLLSRMGIRGLQDPTLGYGEYWRPAPSVPFGSTYWQGLLQDPGVWQRFLRQRGSMRGLF
jgi:hypothetical protein